MQWIRWGLVVGCFEHSNEPFGSINGKEISRPVEHTTSFSRRGLVKGQHLFPFLLNKPLQIYNNCSACRKFSLAVLYLYFL
jgi:hypothetical protein